MAHRLVIGGAASGKSAFAESLVTGTPRVYIATAEARDSEMEAKRDKHRADRGPSWETIEASLDVASALPGLPERAGVLLDCATMWLSNHLFAESDLEAETTRLLDALRACPAMVTVVTNEVGHGIVPADALTRRFREAQGRLNIALAAQAGSVALVTAGLPLWIKGAP